MNVLFTITYFSPYVSGLTLAAKRWAHGLVGTGHRVTVLTMRHDDALLEEEALGGVRVVRANPLLRISKGFLSFDWLVKLVRLLRTHDAVVIHLPEFEGAITALIASLRGKRVIAVYHCEIDLPDGPINEIIQGLVEVVHFLTLLLSNHVVTYTKDYADHSRVLEAVFRVKPHLPVSYIVPPIPRPGTNRRVEGKLKKIIGKDPIVIGVAARLAQEKGIEYLLEGIPILEKNLKKPFRIVIAGSASPVGEDAYRHTIEALVEKYATQVAFVGEIPPEHMGSFYRALTVLVLPSVNSTEAFGMVQVEAMLCGIPVVASDLPGVRVPIEKTGMGRVVPPTNAQALASAITEIIRHRGTYTPHTTNVARVFSERASVSDFLRVLH